MQSDGEFVCTDPSIAPRFDSSYPHTSSEVTQSLVKAGFDVEGGVEKVNRGKRKQPKSWGTWITTTSTIVEEFSIPMHHCAEAVESLGALYAAVMRVY